MLINAKSGFALLICSPLIGGGRYWKIVFNLNSRVNNKKARNNNITLVQTIVSNITLSQ